MAWTTPRTWVAGELVTASMMNTHVRDNMNFLKQYSWTVAATVATGTQNNFDPGIVGNTIIKCQNASALTITGFPAGFDGQLIRLFNASASSVQTAHNSGGSSAGNKIFNFITAGNTILATPTIINSTALYGYETVGARWQLLEHAQGEWISFTPTWGNLGTANTLGNGTITGSYMVRGRVCTVRIKLIWGSTTAAGNNTWSFTLPLTNDGVSLAGAGQAQCFDSSSGGLFWAGLIDIATTSVAVGSIASPSLGFGTTVPFTWAVSDQVALNLTYGIA